MIDFSKITSEKLAELEAERKAKLPGLFVETVSTNPVFNDLRFNHQYVAIGHFLTNIQSHIFELQANEAKKLIYLDFIGVPHEERRKGIGTKMMGLLTSLADKYGYDIELEIKSRWGVSEEILQRFYEKFDFKYVDRDRKIMHRKAKSS